MNLLNRLFGENTQSIKMDVKVDVERVLTKKDLHKAYNTGRRNLAFRIDQTFDEWFAEKYPSINQINNN